MRHRSRISSPPIALSLGLLLPLLAPHDALAQGASLEYTETIRVEAPGLVGTMLGRATGGEERRGVHLLDARLRMDEGSTSTIFDAAEREWTFLDHEAGTYTRLSLADIRQMTAEATEALRESREELEAGREEIEAEMEAAQAEMEEARSSMEVSIEHAATGETDRIQGYSADRHQIIVQLEEAEGVTGAEEVEGGSLVILVDLWISEELARANPLHPDGTRGPSAFHDALVEDPAFREMAEEMAASFEPGEAGGELGAYALVDPRIGAAMGEAAETLSGMEGTPVRTTTIVAVLAPSVELDTELLIAWEPETMGEQIRGEASEAARDAARDAARGAVRSLTRGIMGRNQDDEEDAEVPEEDLVIRPLLRTTSEITDVQADGAPSADLFTIPEGYDELPFPASPGETGAGAGGAAAAGTTAGSSGAR